LFCRPFQDDLPRRLHRSRRGLFGAAFRHFSAGAVLTLAACRPSPPPAPPLDLAAYRASIDAWRAHRLDAVNGEEGWTTLAGLFWLEAGDNRAGSDPASPIHLPAGKAPGFAGTFVLAEDRVRFDAAPHSGITENGRAVTSIPVRADDDSVPTILALGSLSIRVIHRGARFAVRVKDRMHPARTGFTGLHYFPLDTAWRLHARFEPYPAGRTIRIVNILNMVEETPTPGAVQFTVGGRAYRLDAVTERGTTDYFIMFKDSTNADSTYGAGRYLYVSPHDSSGSLIIDFNRSYNPPCAFTTFATCPLPPPQNHLPLAVRAGELGYREPSPPGGP
jgi:hypothetical protein